MSSAELVDWWAFERVTGPILLHERVDAAAAHIVAALTSLGTHEAISVAEHLPQWDAPPVPATPPEDMIATLRSIQRRQRKKES